jgi:hypothetical protein
VIVILVFKLCWSLFVATKEQLIADVLAVDAKHVLGQVWVIVAASFYLENFG